MSEVELCGYKLRSPLMNASGVFSDHPITLKIWEEAGCGCVTTKSVTLGVKKHNDFCWAKRVFSRKFNRYYWKKDVPKLIMIRGSDYTINSMGLPNKGLPWWIEWLSKVRFEVPVNVSVATSTGNLGDYPIIVMRLEPFASMFEINVSCPNIEREIIGYNKQSMISLLETVRSSKPIGYKLPCYFDEASKKPFVLKLDEVSACYGLESATVQLPTKIDKEALREILELLEKYNVRFVTSINTIPVEHPILSMPRGGLSGRPVHDLAVKQAKLISKYSDLEIIGVGGIMNAKDANDFLRIKNVKAVQLASGLFQTDIPHLFVKEILEGIA